MLVPYTSIFVCRVSRSIRPSLALGLAHVSPWHEGYTLDSVDLVNVQFLQISRSRFLRIFPGIKMDIWPGQNIDLGLYFHREGPVSPKIKLTNRVLAEKIWKNQKRIVESSTSLTLGLGLRGRITWNTWPRSPWTAMTTSTRCPWQGYCHHHQASLEVVASRGYP